MWIFTGSKEMDNQILNFANEWQGKKLVAGMHEVMKTVITFGRNTKLQKNWWFLTLKADTSMNTRTSRLCFQQKSFSCMYPRKTQQKKMKRVAWLENSLRHLHEFLPFNVVQSWIFIMTSRERCSRRRTGVKLYLLTQLDLYERLYGEIHRSPHH